MPVTKRVYTKRDHVKLIEDRWFDEDGYPITGIKKSFYPDGTVMDETNLVEGFPEGLQRVYDPTGSLWYENFWKDNEIIRFKKIA